MTFFEQELQKLFGKETLFSDMHIVGNICYGKLSKNVCVKIYFTDMSSRDKYNALKVVLINRHKGEIDSITLYFSDLWGNKIVNNPNLPHGLYPHIWKNDCRNDKNTSWYVYQPTETDYAQLVSAVHDYLNVFR